MTDGRKEWKNGNHTNKREQDVKQPEDRKKQEKHWKNGNVTYQRCLHHLSGHSKARRKPQFTWTFIHLSIRSRRWKLLPPDLLQLKVFKRSVTRPNLVASNKSWGKHDRQKVEEKRCSDVIWDLGGYTRQQEREADEDGGRKRKKTQKWINKVWGKTDTVTH